MNQHKLAFEHHKEAKLTLKTGITCGTTSDPPNAAIVPQISGVDSHSSLLLICSRCGTPVLAACAAFAATSRDHSSTIADNSRVLHHDSPIVQSRSKCADSACVGDSANLLCTDCGQFKPTPAVPREVRAGPTVLPLHINGVSGF